MQRDEGGRVAETGCPTQVRAGRGDRLPVALRPALARRAALGAGHPVSLTPAASRLRKRWLVTGRTAAQTRRRPRRWPGEERRPWQFFVPRVTRSGMTLA